TMDSMYDILLTLPLFNGASREKLSEIAGSTKLHFLKYTPGEKIVTAGESCTHIKFVISGSVRSTVSNVGERFSVSQTLAAPDVISPEFLFGRSTLYPCDVVAVDTAGILQIAKTDYLNILSSDRVFLLNYLNKLSMFAQKGIDGILSFTQGSLDERFAYWIIALTQRSGRDITLTCKQRDLNALFGVQRSSFIAMLDGLKERGVIDYRPGIINILDRGALEQMLSAQD
ncbi:MAG: Crp/Fnr family transcriptional regulator, partial [Muribaculaceae bacterium]|nr:Crp/Fnr family transcriptional regulator [Muribaculaceae bacterium]